MADSIGRPVWAGPRRNRGAGHQIADCLDMQVVEHYEVIDPDLPRARRFRLLGHTLDVRLSQPGGDGGYDDDSTAVQSIPVTSTDLLDLAASVVTMAQQASEHERQDGARKAAGAHSEASP